MSMRGTKRASGVRSADEPVPSTSKRRRTDPEDPLWQLRPVSDLKMSSIYNRSASEAPAELFRKDLISAMKLPDNEPLTPSEYWVITDPWKQDWERGVQVPVNPDSLPAPKVKIIENPLPPDHHDFKLPKDKYIHLSRDVHYQSDKHLLSSTPACAEAACSYDLDAVDTCWLKLLNAERARAGASPITEEQLEKVVEELEVRTWDKIQAIMKSEEGLGIEYDENVICDVCRSPDSEDGNEMVFCDSCNICVHQACYGITVIPDGQWLCRPCGDGTRPTCVLCPNLGGAMKCTPSGHKWAHVSCVLWIPEVSIGCAEKMEPITKISSIPASRWSLACVLCRERKGACIQCSVKSCKTAYHVTCAFKHGLEMRAIIEDENADDGVKLRSYCQKHSVNSKKEKCSGSGSEEEEVKRKRRKDMTSEEKTQARAARLQEIEKEFDKHVSVKDISSHLLDVDQDAINYIYNYWKLKRRAGQNRPLLPPKSDDNELLTHRQEQADLDKMKMFVQLRQDLERVRNLCYMVSRREKLSRSFFRMREQTFHKQVAVLSGGDDIPDEEMAAIVEANHGPSIYDRLYSHPDAADHKSDFDELLAKIAPPSSSDERKKDRNGLVRRSRSSNPYKKHYVNGTRRSGSMYSGLSSEESESEFARTSKYRARAIDSSTDDNGDQSPKKKSSTSPKKKISPKTKAKPSPKKNERKKKKVPQSKALVESSSEDDGTRSKKERMASKTLRQMEKEMAAGKQGHSGTDSDDLMPIRTTRNSKFPVDIYSDSSEDSSSHTKVAVKSENKVKSEKDTDDKFKAEKSPCGNDSQQSLPRTKAAMKEFVPSHAEKKEPTTSVEEKPAPKKRGRKPSNKEKKPPIKTNDSDDEAKNKENKFAKQKDNPTDLIVPQRQAAKKASENMRSTSTGKKEDTVAPVPEKVSDDIKAKLKGKGKGKEIKSPPVKLTRQTSKEAEKETEKETIAYVPQRQAAKKAAAHIKNIGSKLPVAETPENNKKKDEKPETPKSPKSDEVKKSDEKDSSSSSSNSSSSSYSSSSSSEDEVEKPGPKPTAKAREIKPAIRQPSMFSPPSTRPTVDLPFLDKVSKPLSSTSGTSDTDTSQSDRSDGSTPIVKRPRRRRKQKSVSTDASPRKAPDKKLKTSERDSECGDPSATAQREEPPRAAAAAARAATRARTRSTTASGGVPNKHDAGSRKSSKDDAGHPTTPNKTPKESRQSSELPTPERKTHAETVKQHVKSINVDDDSRTIEQPKNDVKPKVKENKAKRPSISIEEKDNNRTESRTDRLPEISSPLETKPSPRKSVEAKQKISSRRMSVKEPVVKEVKEPEAPVEFREEPRQTIKQRRQSRYEQNSSSNRTNTSPVKKPVVEKPPVELPEKKSPIHMNDSFNDSDKWLTNAPSPQHVLTPIERAGGNEKYMTDDKLFDSDCTEKTSVKMIAKIQANLNENTMIKSPKTPMDARSMAMDSEVDNPYKNIRKRSTLETITQDASHLQGVEISKSAKIPSTLNLYTNRAMFSPQQKDNELFPFDMMAVDDGFNHDEIMKPFSSYPEFFFKEDSKEQSVQATLNLVDRLRMQLSSKKAPADNGSHEQSAPSGDEKDQRDEEHNAEFEKEEEELSPGKETVPELETHSASPKAVHNAVNHVQHTMTPPEIPRHEKDYQPIPMTSNEKWAHEPAISHSEPQIDHTENRKYDHNTYNEEVKELSNVNSDAHSASEVGDTASLSKQSDDSQPSVVENSVHSNDVELNQDTQNYENNNSVIHSDCATISSPYISQEKWRESKITTRRSSASSTNSEGSMISQERDRSVMKTHMNACDAHSGPVLPEIDSYPPIPAYSCPVEPSMPLNQYSTYPPNASPFLSTMGSLFAASACSQLPLPSPGPLYAPGIPYSSAPLMPPKPPFPLCAAFTSSSQNIALTTAMIAPPTPKPMDSPREDIDVTGSDKFSIHVASSPSISVDDSYEASRNATKISNDSNETMASATQQESKSPPKITPISKPKFPGKSPGKSPGISPRQSEGLKGTKRTSNKSNRSARGRGRSKSRGQPAHSFSAVDTYMGNSIQSKLVGTVYDFEEEIANDGVDLKALRERRKSVDVRDDRRSEHSFKDASQSPHVPSPQAVSKRTPTEEFKENAVKPAIPELVQKVESPVDKETSERGPGFSHVTPVLPGPVDMRTYQPLDAPAPPAARAANYHSHLLGLPAAAAVDHTLTDLEEEADKTHLPSETRIPPAPTLSPPPAPPPYVPPKEPYMPLLPKVSLSDSRNQLKVKIKGPFLDANYSTSSVTPVPPPPPVPVHETPANVMNAGMPSSMMSGSTNLRRMRKKELLRQYWTQDMNMDDPTNTAIVGATQVPAAPSPITRAVITIPKAVASMTSIPTREDYRMIDTPVEKKKRKVSSGLSRELRHLKVTMNDEVDPADDVKLTAFVGNVNQAHKRRGRISTKPGRANATSPVAPKLKIKIGANTVQQVNEEPSDFRPPKKRLIHKPSLEDLRRESMKYRRKVMADFAENEKTTKHKSSRSEKRKRKKDKKADKLQVVNSESDSATKLIIKIKRPTAPEGGGEASSASMVTGAAAAAAAAPEPPVDPFDYDPTAPDPLALDTPSYSEATSAMRKVRTAKVTPIRLKLARTQGTSYVMKEGSPAAPPAHPAPPPPALHDPAPVDPADVR